jgi:hypothetical protein
MHHDFSKLLQRPGCCGVGGDVEVSDPASSDFQKNEQPSSQPPLLGASPLRTGLESFPSSGSSIPERPHEKRGRSRIQQQMNTTYSILICGQLARQWGNHQRVGSCTSSLRHRRLLCFLHRFHKCSRVGTPSRSQLRFRRGHVVPSRRLDLYLPDYRAAFASSQFRFPHRHRSTLRLIFPLQGAIRAYPVPRR